METTDPLHDILARLESDENPNALDSAGSKVSPNSELGGKLTDPRDLTRPSSASKIVVEVGAGLDFDPTFASFGQRALGAVVDAIVVAVAVLPGIVILQIGGSTFVSLLGAAIIILGFFAVVVFGARSIAATGKWIGNRVTGTTVVHAVNGSLIDPGSAGLRMFARHVISPIFLFGYLMAFADGQRRTFHDLLAGSVVITRQREVWTAQDD